jgi:S-adenosylmethionine:tRNA ribosyltransferase-isomerase
MTGTPREFRLADFDFDLPAELIAQTPPAERSASRLLVVGGESGGAALSDRMFRDLPALLDPADLVVFNDTRVINARLAGVKESGGKAEIMIERQTGARAALAQIRASHAPKPGSTIAVGDFVLRVVARDDRFFHLRVEGEATLDDVLARHGEVPLPPYIERPADAVDAERYQTIYAREPGAVAAPTAGLHFDRGMLEALAARGIRSAFVTLHVGAGTLLPVQVERLSEHRMHSEWFDLPQATVDAIAQARVRGGRIVAIGTTTLRALESAAADGTLRAGAQETRLFITPGFRFRVVDRLLTNFHLPKSTLLMLVSAFAGYAEIRATYAHAVRERYRFFSYGDAMLLTRKGTTP